MKKSTPLVVFFAGLLSLQCGLRASPAILAFVDDAPAFPPFNLSLAWLTVGSIAVIVGALGILFLGRR